MSTFFGILAIMLWGGLALLGLSTQAIPAFQLLAMCFFISALLMFVKRLLCAQPLLKKSQMTPAQWLVGIMGLFGFHFCYFIALKNAPAIEVSLIAYLWPMLLAILVADKSNRFKALIGGLVGFIGISFIILDDSGLALNWDYLLGYGLAACCALIWSLYSWFLST